jgi:hypothetical protein
MPGFTTEVPNVARIYVFLLGGKDNFLADRDAARELQHITPDASVACRENRAFIRRAVRWLARDAGISQFIDIGSGFPMPGNVHEIACLYRDDARVLYVDNDPVVISHAMALLCKSPRVVAVQRDLRAPGSILGHPAATALLDFSQPVAVVLGAVLHFIADDEDPYGIVADIMTVLPPGSYLVISHATADGSGETAADVRALYAASSASAHPRNRIQVERFFDGCSSLGGTV